MARGGPLDEHVLPIFRALLENGRKSFRKLGEELGLNYKTVIFHYQTKIEPLGGQFTYFVNPEKLGLKIFLVRAEAEPRKLEQAVASLTVSPLVRMLFIEPYKEDIWMLVVGADWQIEEFKRRLKTTPGVKDYELIPLQSRKFEQPIPVEALDEIASGAGK